MPSDLWTLCEGASYISSIQETAWRLTETKEKIALRDLVDSLEELDTLESIISPNPSAGITELLFKPFRQPPLKYGSRFGNALEPSLWYGSLKLQTAMAEKAFYKFNFLRASKAKYISVNEELTAFSAHIKTEQGIKLEKLPFLEYENLISSAGSYEDSQLLGSAMKQANINAFTFKSARDPNQEVNIALFTPNALHKKPDLKSFQSWQCIANDNTIEFIRLSSVSSERVLFSIEQFMKNGFLPFPAN